jgi:hypothetical protein
MRNNMRPPNKVLESLNTNDLIAQYMIKHNTTTYSGRITYVGQSVFLETQKIPHQNATFLKARKFCRGPADAGHSESECQALSPLSEVTVTESWSVRQWVCDTSLGVRVAAAEQSLSLSRRRPGRLAGRGRWPSRWFKFLHAIAGSFHSSWCSGSHCGQLHSFELHQIQVCQGLTVTCRPPCRGKSGCAVNLSPTVSVEHAVAWIVLYGWKCKSLYTYIMIFGIYLHVYVLYVHVCVSLVCMNTNLNKKWLSMECLYVYVYVCMH